MHKLHVHHKHKAYYVALTIGLLVSQVVPIVFPHMQNHAAVIGTLSNLAWLWFTTED